MNEYDADRWFDSAAHKFAYRCYRGQYDMPDDTETFFAWIESGEFRTAAADWLARRA